jgi:hypothetical protein
MRLWFTRQTRGIRGYFLAIRGNGLLRTGLDPDDFVVTIVEPADGDSNNPAVAESVEKPGLYYFDVPTGFLGTYGNGDYGVSVEIDTRNGPSAPPHVVDAFGAILTVSTADLDTINNNLEEVFAYADGVYVSSSYGSAGTTFPVGTRSEPANSLANGTTIAGNYGSGTGFRKLVFIDDNTYTLNQAYNEWYFQAEAGATVDLNSQSVVGSRFDNLIITGSGTLGLGIMDSCLLNSVAGSGVFFRCGFAFKFSVSSVSYFTQCAFGGDVQISTNNNDVFIVNSAGAITIQTMSSGTVELGGFRGIITIDSSCTGGTINISGNGLLIDESGTGCTVNAIGFITNEEFISERTKVAAGSTSTNVRTNLLAYANDFFNDMQIIVVSSSRRAVRRIKQYIQTNAEFVVDALPFTPAVGDEVFVIARTGAYNVADIWSEALPGAYGVGEAGRIVGDNLDTNVGSRAAPGDQMDLINDAVDSNSLANSAVVEIDTELTIQHGSGSWQSATVAPSGVAQAVWSEPLPGAYNIGEAGNIVGNDIPTIKVDVAFLKQYMEGNWKIINNQMIFYDSDGTTPLRTYNLYKEDGTPGDTDTYERRKV